MRHNIHIPELLFPLESFTLECEARNLRPSTIKAYRDNALMFYQYMVEQGLFRVEDVAARDVRAYVVSLRQRGLAEATVAGYFRTLRVFFNFLVSDDLIAKSPLDKLKIPKADTMLKPAFTEREIQRLIAAAPNARDKALLLFLLDTGARISEVLAADVGDVDIARGRVHLRHTKDREQRIVYLGVKAKRALLKYYRLIPISPDAPLWIVLRTKKRLKKNGVTQLLRRLGDATGIPDNGPHKFRRTFAVSFLRNGGDIFSLQRILGHSSLDMVRQYLGGLNDDDTAKAHSLYAPGDRMASNG